MSTIFRLGCSWLYSHLMNNHLCLSPSRSRRWKANFPTPTMKNMTGKALPLWMTSLILPFWQADHVLLFTYTETLQLPSSVIVRRSSQRCCHQTMAETDMQHTPKRTPRACERCRQTRRRCEPPYPCRQCVQSGVACDVREKARPHRRQQQPRPEGRRKAANTRNGEKFLPQRNATTKASERRPVQGDTYETLRALVEDLLLDRQGRKYC